MQLPHWLRYLERQIGGMLQRDFDRTASLEKCPEFIRILKLSIVGKLFHSSSEWKFFSEYGKLLKDLPKSSQATGSKLTNTAKPETCLARVVLALKLAIPTITFFECHYLAQYLKASLTTFEPELVLKRIEILVSEKFSQEPEIVVP